jgi:hypothetical protein
MNSRKRLLSFLFLQLVFFNNLVLCFALQNNPPPPPPPPAKDYTPKLWIEFAAPEGTFKVSFPGVPQISSQEVPAENVKVILHSIKYRSFISYSVSYTDYPMNIDAPDTVKQFLAGIKDAGVSAIARWSPRILSDEDIVFDGHPGKFAHLELSNNSRIRLKWIAFKNRVYIISITTPIHEQAMDSENGYEKIANNFFKSFQLLKTEKRK